MYRLKDDLGTTMASEQTAQLALVHQTIPGTMNTTAVGGTRGEVPRRKVAAAQHHTNLGLIHICGFLPVPSRLERQRLSGIRRTDLLNQTLPLVGCSRCF